MHIEVMLKRNIPREKAKELLALIHESRKQALHQRGFMTGKTLWSVDRPDENVEVSTWRSREYWEAWKNSDERKKLQQRIDALDPNCVTTCEIYRYPDYPDDVEYDALVALM